MVCSEDPRCGTEHSHADARQSHRIGGVEALHEQGSWNAGIVLYRQLNMPFPLSSPATGVSTIAHAPHKRMQKSKTSQLWSKETRARLEGVDLYGQDLAAELEAHQCCLLMEFVPGKDLMTSCECPGPPHPRYPPHTPTSDLCSPSHSPAPATSHSVLHLSRAPLPSLCSDLLPKASLGFRCSFAAAAFSDPSKLKATVEDLGRLLLCDMALGNPDRLPIADLGWRGNLSNVLFGSFGPYKDRVVAIDSSVPRKPPQGVR